MNRCLKFGFVHVLLSQAIRSHGRVLNTIVNAGGEFRYELKSKAEVAADIFALILAGKDE